MAPKKKAPKAKATQRTTPPPLACQLCRSLTGSAWGGRGHLITNSEVVFTAAVPAGGNIAAYRAVIPCFMPWLDSIAKGYQRFRWHHIRATFLSYGGKDAAGMVGMTYFVDSRDRNPGTIAELAIQHKSSVGPYASVASMAQARNLGAGFGSSVGVDLPCRTLAAADLQRTYDYVAQPAWTAMSAEARDARTPLSICLVLEGLGAAVPNAGVMTYSYIVELLEPISPVLNM